MYLPSRAFGAAIALRSVVLWAGIRAATLALELPLTMGAHSFLVVVLVVFLAGHDRAVLKEQVLLANAGIARGTLHGFSATPAVACEIALHLAAM
jgi:hypothetical protein